MDFCLGLIFYTGFRYQCYVLEMWLWKLVTIRAGGRTPGILTHECWEHGPLVPSSRWLPKSSGDRRWWQGRPKADHFSEGAYPGGLSMSTMKTQHGTLGGACLSGAGCLQRGWNRDDARLQQEWSGSLPSVPHLLISKVGLLRGWNGLPPIKCQEQGRQCSKCSTQPGRVKTATSARVAADTASSGTGGSP